MVEAMESCGFIADQVKVYWMIQGDPQYAFLPAGTNDEIDLTLVPRNTWRPVVSEEVTKPDAPGFCVTLDSESENSRTAEEHVVCNRPQEDGTSASGQDQPLEKRVTSNTSLKDVTLSYRRQGLLCVSMNEGRRCLDLVPVIFYADGGGHQGSLCTMDKTQGWCQFSWDLQVGGRAILWHVLDFDMRVYGPAQAGVLTPCKGVDVGRSLENFNDRVAQVQPQHKELCMHLAVVDYGASSTPSV